MKPLFTIHAGEYLVGTYIEQNHPRWNIWIPSKNTGVDLIVTDSRNNKAVVLQIKFSKDFNPTHHPAFIQNRPIAAGWRTLHDQKTIYTYLWVIKTRHCWETRGFTEDQERIVFGRFSDEFRDFSPFLNAWHQVEKILK